QGLELERGADSSADLTECPKLRNRPGKFARARLHVLEQPHVLDRDHRLIREGGDQLDLLVGKRSRLGACQCQHADRVALAQHRNGENRAKTAESLCFCPSVLRVSPYVRDMNDLAFNQGSPGSRPSSRLDRQGSGVFAEFGRITVTYSANEYAAFPSTDHRLVSVAKLGSRLDQRIEHGLQVESRTADDLKHVGCGGLLLE